MFIGHLPAGYILTQGIIKLTGCRDKKQYACYLWAGLLASILPDLDLVYFYFMDNRQHAHHSYWPHIPFYWLMFYACFYTTGMLLKNKFLKTLTIIFTLNIFNHLLLDSIAGGIYWLYPFSDKYLVLSRVAAKHHWWVLNFILHWTFMLEVIIILAALYLYSKLSSAKVWKDH